MRLAEQENQHKQDLAEARGKADTLQSLLQQQEAANRKASTFVSFALVVLLLSSCSLS